MGNKSSRDALEGRGAVITGANSGIGLEVTKKLLEYGMVIVGIDGDTSKLDVSLTVFIDVAFYLDTRVWFPTP